MRNASRTPAWRHNRVIFRNTETTRSRWRGWIKGLSAALLVLMLALWITSLFRITWTAPTRRHKVSLFSGVLIVDVQASSIPSALPADATADMRQIGRASCRERV